MSGSPSDRPGHLLNKADVSFKVKCCDWNTYYISALAKLNQWEPVSSYDYYFVKEVVNENVPIRKKVWGKKPKPPTPWWDDECQNLVLERKEKLRIFKIIPTIAIEYKRCCALSSWCLRRKKNRNLLAFVMV